jgi:hypothetical protein
VVAVAGVLFAGIYARRDFDSSPGDAVLVLFVVPIALWAIAEVFDASTHERPYKQTRPPEATLDELNRLSGTHFDPRVLEDVLRLAHAALVEPARRPGLLVPAQVRRSGRPTPGPNGGRQAADFPPPARAGRNGGWHARPQPA